WTQRDPCSTARNRRRRSLHSIRGTLPMRLFRRLPRLWGGGGGTVHAGFREAGLRQEGASPRASRLTGGLLVRETRGECFTGVRSCNVPRETLHDDRSRWRALVRMGCRRRTDSTAVPCIGAPPVREPCAARRGVFALWHKSIPEPLRPARRRMRAPARGARSPRGRSALRRSSIIERKALPQSFRMRTMARASFASAL